MASSSGTSESTRVQNSGSEEGLMDQRKRKRMQSNRESARRSRMRKQKHLDDLTAEINRFKKDNSQIQATVGLTTQQFVHVEAENSVLRAQIGELTQRLDSLNEIMGALSGGDCTTPQCTGGTSGLFEFEHNEFMNHHPWSLMCFNQQPIMASAADMFQ